MPSDRTIGVGIIGLGARGAYAIALNMVNSCLETGFRIAAVCDRNTARMIELRDVLVRMYRDQVATAPIRLHQDGLELIRAPEVDLVMVTSPTYTHRQYAVPALHSGKKVYCDKPLAHTLDDASAIVEAEAAAANPLVMGFTRRYETAWCKAQELMQGGAIGALAMIQVRDIIPYSRYLTAWWRRRAWSGGALNDKGSHIFDVFNWFAGGRPVRIHGLGGRTVLRPDPTAPPRCSLCDRACPYRRRLKGGAPYARDLRTHFGPSWLAETEERYLDDICVYAPGSDIYHNGSIHLTYDNGVIASYVYTVFGPRAPDQETLELIGAKGRLRLTRRMGTLDLVTEHGERCSVIDCHDETFSTSHFGADLALIKELRSFCDGAPPRVSARDGLRATRLVMAALQSMDAGGATIELDDDT